MSIYRKDKDGKLHRIASSYIEKKGDPALTIADFYEIDTELNVDDIFETHINAFNRKPAVGDMYSQIAKGYDEIVGRSWIINLIITSVSDNIATSRIKGIVETTGPQGPQGPQGEQGPKGDTGNEALTTNTIFTTSKLPEPGLVIKGVPVASVFARTPEITDHVLIIIKGTGDYDGRTWLAGCIVDLIYEDGTAEVRVMTIVETTGAQGPQGEQGEQGIQGPKGDTGSVDNIKYGDIITKLNVGTFDTFLDRLEGNTSNYYGYNIYFRAVPEDNGGVEELIPLAHDVYSGTEKGTYFIGKNYVHRIFNYLNEWEYESYPKERAETAPGIYMFDYSEKVESRSYVDSVDLTSDMFLPPIDINQFDTIYAITNVGQLVKCRVQFDGGNRVDVWDIIHIRDMGVTADTISVNTIKTNGASEITFSSTTAFDKNVHINAGKKLYVEKISGEPESRGGTGRVEVTSSTDFTGTVFCNSSLHVPAATSSLYVDEIKRDTADRISIPSRVYMASDVRIDNTLDCNKRILTPAIKINGVNTISNKVKFVITNNTTNDTFYLVDGEGMGLKTLLPGESYTSYSVRTIIPADSVSYSECFIEPTTDIPVRVSDEYGYRIYNPWAGIPNFGDNYAYLQHAIGSYGTHFEPMKESGTVVLSLKDYEP